LLPPLLRDLIRSLDRLWDRPRFSDLSLPEALDLSRDLSLFLSESRSLLLVLVSLRLSVDLSRSLSRFSSRLRRSTSLRTTMLWRWIFSRINQINKYGWLNF
jgi:hypothetical protein